ncbi:hypothetical protein C8Q74DRAFT_1362580 [Fomes fomentarius]|nr:hypothetical protein C8Q74DRAFT_1362580 [Fomes fomentarius]
MFMILQSTLITNRRQQKKMEMMELLQNNTWKTTMTNWLVALLLSPYLTAYVTDINAHIMSLVMDEPDNCGVPYDMITNPDPIAKLTETVITLLP